MKRLAIIGFFSFWASFVTFWGLGITQPNTEALGQDLYKKRCATCHSADGAGNQGMGKILKVTFKHLGSPEVQEKSDEELAAIILEGFGKMKPVKGLSAADVAAVLGHTRSLKLD